MKLNVEKLEVFGGHRDCVYNLSKIPDSSQFMSVAGDGLLVKWDLHQPDLGIPLAKMKNSSYALTFDNTTKKIWVADNFEGLRKIGLNEKQEIKTIAFNKTHIFDLKIFGDHVFAAGGDGVLSVIQKHDVVFVKHIKCSDKSARTIAINPVERELAVGYSDHFIRIFDLQNFGLKKQFKAHENSIFTLKYTPDFQRLISAGRDAHLKIWDVQQNYEIQEDVVAHMYAINDLAFRPEGDLFATCSMDKSIKIWDASTAKLLKVIDKARHAGHGTSINKLLWMSDNELLSASDDRTISLWKVQ